MPMPCPISNFVVKVHSRCNLDCTYCYEYNRGNEGWKSKPREMSLQTFRRMCERIRNHVARHKLPHVSLALHGGEPLLRKPAFFTDVACIAREVLSPVCTYDMGVQTNGILLSDEHLDVFLRHQMRIGVSLDGPPEVNDKFRIYRRSGRSSYRRAVNGIEKLARQPYREIWGGMLAVIDVGHDPLEIFHHLAQFEPPTIDFLEPDGTWDKLPKGKASTNSCEYGDWLIAIFDDWFSSNQHIKVRKFEEIMLRLLGGVGEMEYFGLEPVALAVVATDGAYEAVDQIKTVKDGIETTGMNVYDHEIDEILNLDLIRARQTGLDALCSTCVQCQYVTSCGGGYFPHRYSEARGFGNPSIYCADYLKLFGHIKRVLMKELGNELEPAAAA